MARLADGSFIVYDGGMNDTLTQSKEYARQNARRILETLKTYGTKNSDGKYVIAAWVITHGHIDHIGALEAFINADYETEVTLERIITNLPSDEQISRNSEDKELGSKMSVYRSLYRTVKNEGTIIHKAHPGQIYAIRNASIEVLYTYDLMCEKEIELFNNTSVVTRLTLGGQTVMITGDMQGDAAAAMIKLYDDTMKSDFISVPHHGWFVDGTEQFYRLVDPDYVLWPIGDDRRDEVTNKNKWPVNQYFFKEDLKIFYAGDRTILIPLPYSGSGETVIDKEIYE
jgi:beta-lactamase superfamily II metal-dependent hydrolase